MVSSSKTGTPSQPLAVIDAAHTGVDHALDGGDLAAAARAATVGRLVDA